MAELGIIADDLSGACDAAAEFASRNFSCRVDLTGMLDGLDEVDVLAVSTETRTATPAEAFAKVVKIFERMRRAGIQYIYKKIDSTLRGNCRVEIDALLSGSQFERAFILPAFPEMQRLVKSGCLYINDDPSPALHMSDVFGKRDLRCISSDECTDQLAVTKGLFVVDTSTREELRQAAQSLWRRLAGTLLVGSAGLAAEIAELMRKDAGLTRDPLTCPFPSSGKPFIFVVGSTCDHTLAQIDFLKRYRELEVIELGPRWDLAARQMLLDNRDIVLSIDCDRVDMLALLKLRQFTGESLISTLVVTGGYTARVVCEILEARGIRMCGNLLPGIAMGILIGGYADALPIVTKAGGFGGADTLARIPPLLRDEKAA